MFTLFLTPKELVQYFYYNINSGSPLNIELIVA